jgi:hypothetical protein
MAGVRHGETSMTINRREIKILLGAIVILSAFTAYELFQEQSSADRQHYREFIMSNPIVLSNFGNLHSISFKQHGFDGDAWYVKYLILGSKDNGTVTIDYDNKSGSITKAYLVKNMGATQVDIYP